MESLDKLAKSRLLDLTRKIEVEDNRASTPSPKSLITVGDLVDHKYQIEALIGEGGMGAVYKARHRDLAKDVALKTFRVTELDPDSWQRFKREAQAMARLAHPNIVQIFDFGVTEANMPFYTMEYLSGESLAERTARGGNGRLNDTLRIFIKTAQALSAAHKKGIIHRDVKPGNIFLIGDGRDVKVVDFGIAGLVSEAVDAQKLTTTGSVFGSPLYMSPEQSVGASTGPASDIYSFACSLFEILSGAVPFRGANAFATMLMHQNQLPPALTMESGEALPPSLVQLMDKMLAKNAALRPQSFDQIAQDLEAIVLGKDINFSTDKPNKSDEADIAASDPGARRPAFNAIFHSAAVALVLTGVGAYFLLMPKPPAVVPQNIHPGYYQGIVDGHKVYQFPDGVDFGKITWEDPKQPLVKPQKYHAIGKLLLPPTGTISLETSSEVSRNPQLLDGLRGNDLLKLIIKNGRNSDLKHIGQLTDLRMLVLPDSDIDDGAAEDLNKLGSLQWLEVTPSKMTAQTYENLPYLGQLQALHLSHVTAVGGLLKRLQKSTKLTVLSLIECNLCDDDLKAIDKLPGLVYLVISDNQGITDENLKLLHKARLARLDLDGTKVSPAALATLKNIMLPHRSDGAVRVSQNLWDAQTRAKIGAELGTPVKLSIEEEQLDREFN